MLSILNTTAQQNPWEDTAYAVIFSDEFTQTDSLNTAKWMRRTPWGFGWDSNMVEMTNHTWVDLGWREPSYTDTNTLRITDGTLKLKVKKENVTGTCWTWPACSSGSDWQCNGDNNCSNSKCWHKQDFSFKYVTAMLYSRYKFKYGYFEIKFKLPSLPTSPSTFNGVGPNFWLFGADTVIHWSEIDIFEMHGNTNVLTNAAHYMATGSSTHYVDSYSYGTITGNTWHTASVHWRPDGIDYYLDRQYIRSMDDANVKLDSLVEMPVFVDINVPTYGWNESFDTTTVFPYIYEIDYVKVWQLKETCTDSLIFCSNLNPATYNSQVYKNISIGGTGCSDPVSNTSNISFYGKDYVLLQEGFSIDTNSNVLINVQPCQGSSNHLRTAQGSDIYAPPAGWNSHLTK